MRRLRHEEAGFYEDNDNSATTKASNAFAFGTIFYELLTAEWPWRDGPRYKDTIRSKLVSPEVIKIQNNLIGNISQNLFTC